MESYKFLLKSNGPEKAELTKLFQTKVIDEDTKPNTIRLKYPIFRKFNTKVFASHLIQIKSIFFGGELF